MSLNATPSGERVHIGIFGKRNAGKSSLINALTGQKLAIVSDIAGTTTDPVLKAMELLPLGPVVLIDTPGLDDDGKLGKLRIARSYQMLNKSDIALLVVDACAGITPEDAAILDLIKKKEIPYLVVYNKADRLTCAKRASIEGTEADRILVSAATGENINELRERIGALQPKEEHPRQLIADLLQPGDFVVLVIPIDSSAPKGRLILPQQMVIRDVLEAGAIAISTKETTLTETLQGLSKKPRLVVTDSQAFKRVSGETPEDIYLTSFSILMSRYKGDLPAQAAGAAALLTIKDGDKILISEGCTHHRQCEDIGTVKLPGWIRSYTKAEPVFEFTSGTEFPADLSAYKLIVHCGGCMLNDRELKYRLKCAQDAGVPMTNYGTAIAAMNGILDRSLKVFGETTFN